MASPLGDNAIGPRLNDFVSLGPSIPTVGGVLGILGSTGGTITNLLGPASGVVSGATGLGGNLNALTYISSQVNKLTADTLGQGGIALLNQLKIFGAQALAVINNIISLEEPQRSYKWLVLLPTIGGVSFSSWLVLRVTPPSNILQTDKVYQGDHPSNLPADTSATTFPMSLYMDQSNAALNYITVWKGLIKNEDRTYNYENTFKKSIILYLFDVENDPVATISAVGCFPTSAQINSIGYDSADHMTLDVVFAVDNVRTIILNAPPTFTNTNALLGL